jgi:sensor histidine kinase YesM
MTLASWLLVLGVYQLTESMSGRFGWLYDIPFDVPAVLIVALLVLPAYPLVLKLHDRHVWWKWAFFFVVALAIASAQSVVNLIENRLLGTIPAFDMAYADLIRERFARVMQGHFYKTFANITLMAFTVQVRDGLVGRLELAEVSARVDRERLTALRLQLNPHFLFNTLNSISSLVGAGRSDDADEMIDRLSDFLRQTLEEDVEAIVTLGQELASIDSYLAVERIRFGDRLRLQVDIDRALRSRLRVPSMILQPLIENALKYGVAGSSAPVTLSISARIDGEEAVVTVSDDGPGTIASDADVVSTGVGLRNIRERLAGVYGAQASFAAGPRPGGGWHNEVRLPRPE